MAVRRQHPLDPWAEHTARWYEDEKQRLASIVRMPYKPRPLSAWRKARLRFVMWVARRFSVPVDVHGSFFANGTNHLNRSALATGPK